MAEPMQLPQPKTFNQRADPADAQWSYDQSRPEAEMPTDLEAKIGAEHIEARVSEIQHAHHAEHQGQSARQHEKQHPVKDAVESRENDDLEHRSRSFQRMARSALCDDRSPRLALRPLHFAGCRQNGVARLQGAYELPSPAGAFLVEFCAGIQGAEAADIHILKQLMVVL